VVEDEETDGNGQDEYEALPEIQTGREIPHTDNKDTIQETYEAVSEILHTNNEDTELETYEAVTDQGSVDEDQYTYMEDLRNVDNLPANQDNIPMEEELYESISDK